MPLSKLWLASGLYLLVLILFFAFIIPDAHLPVMLELLLKGTAVLAFCALLITPAFHVATRFRQGKKHPILMIGAGIVAAGYALLFGLLLYVMFKACDPHAIPHDSRWHCNVEGKSIVAYFVLVPILAVIVSLVVTGIYLLAKKIKAKDGQ